MERQFLQWLYNRINRPDHVSVGVGDDAAILQVTDQQTVVTSDAIVENVHFLCEASTWNQIGHKALAVNLSDLAAMGAEPIAHLLTLIVSKQKLVECQQMVEGILETASKYSCPLIGGDFVVAKDSPLTLSVTAIGKIPADQDAWTMGNAKVGDQIFVTGDLGGSILGKHLDFSPRIQLARQLRQARLKINAATDISDGMAGDLARLCAASRVGAVLQLDNIPLSDAAAQLANRRGGRPIDHALRDGEDFELILVVPSNQQAIMTQSTWETPLTHVGEIVERHGLWHPREGKLESLDTAGYDHG